MRIHLRSLLENKNIRIVEAGTLAEARAMLRRASTPRPDFIVLDIDLPDGSGLDIMPDVPTATLVVALTADVTREIELQCFSAGCDLVIEKSHHLHALPEVIAKHAELEVAQGARDVEVCPSYITFLAEVLIDIEEARNTADFPAARRIAHRLRGTAIHFGFPGISSAANAVSAALSAGQLEQFETSILSLRDRIGDALETHYKTIRKLTIEAGSA